MKSEKAHLDNSYPLQQSGSQNCKFKFLSEYRSVEYTSHVSKKLNIVSFFET